MCWENGLAKTIYFWLNHSNILEINWIKNLGTNNNNNIRKYTNSKTQITNKILQPCFHITFGSEFKKSSLLWQTSYRNKNLQTLFICRLIVLVRFFKYLNLLQYFLCVLHLTPVKYFVDEKFCIKVATYLIWYNNIFHCLIHLF